MIHCKIAGTNLAEFLLVCVFGLTGLFCHAQQKSNQPNIVILLADDMGYGDLQCYGNPTIKTPHINALALEGIRFTSFVAAPWCVPSRAELMTGCYKPRINFNGDTGAGGHGGIPDSTLTLAQGLRKAGYATGMAGKWHLGYHPKKYLPTNKGFDSWLGLPYSNDYKRPYVQTDVPLVMYRDTTVVEYPVNQDSLTVKYTAEAIRFIRQHSKGQQPFFFYLAYNMPHLPLHTTNDFFGRSGAGLYGDVIETIDWSVGQVLKTLQEEGLSENTIVFFASDNGPWQNAPPRMFLIPEEREGSNWKIPLGNKPWNVGSSGPLRGYKHTTYEGGPRVPAMIRWPGHIKPGQVSDELVANLDIFATFLKAGGGQLPGYDIDGLDMIPFFTGNEKHSSRNEYVYFINECQGIRVGEWKLREVGGETELFNMQYDPGELYNQAKQNPDLVKRLRTRMYEMAKYAGTKVAGSAK
jgi:arylsulfatase A-like enzyme